MNEIDEQVRRAQAAVRGEVILREELARQAGLPSTTLAKMLDADWNPTRKTLSAVVGVLDEIGFFCPTPAKRGRVLERGNS
mgnify:CR=1 FL=1